MHSYHGDNIIAHYDGGLNGEIIIVDKNNTDKEIRFEFKEIISIIEKEECEQRVINILEKLINGRN